MNVRRFTKAAAIVGLVASPVAAQAAPSSTVEIPQRASSSVELGNEMRGSSWVIGILALAAIIAAIIIATSDDNDPVSP